MEETPIQRLIEERITNGLGYAPRITEKDLQRYEQSIKYGIKTYDTELGLQIYLGSMDARTARDYFSRKFLLDNVLNLAEMRRELQEYGIEDRLETPTQVVYALHQWYQRKRSRDPRMLEPKNAEFFVSVR